MLLPALVGITCCSGLTKGVYWLPLNTSCYSYNKHTWLYEPGSLIKKPLFKTFKNHSILTYNSATARTASAFHIQFQWRSFPRPMGSIWPRAPPPQQVQNLWSGVASPSQVSSKGSICPSTADTAAQWNQKSPTWRVKVWNLCNLLFERIKGGPSPASV